MPDEKKPWEDESLKGEYWKEKKRMSKPPLEEGSPKPPSLTGAFGEAARLERRNKKIEKATKPLRKALPGQGQ